MSEKNKASDFETQASYTEEIDIRLDTDEPSSFGDAIDDLDDESKSSLQDIMSDKKKLAMMIGVGLIFIIIIVVIIIGAKGSKKPQVDLGAAPMPYVDKTLPEVTLRFTNEQVSRLRQVGYTGREIQEAEVNGQDAEEMFNKAVIEKDKYLQERYRVLSKDITAPEVRKLLDYTWFGLPQQTVNAPEIDQSTGKEDISQVFITPIRENVDYERVPFYGHQCLIKLYLSDNIVAYTAINPGVFVNLPDKGNAVVNYKKMNYRGAIFVNEVSVEGF